MNEQGQRQIRSPQVIAAEHRDAARAGAVVAFASVRLCPACMAPRGAATMRYHSGESTTFGAVADPPYLRVTCGVCQFAWSEAPAWTA